MPIPIILGGIAATAAITGLVKGTSGISKMKDAKNIQENAVKESDKNIKRYHIINDSVIKNLDNLGKKQFEVMKSFEKMVDIIEKIKNIEIDELEKSEYKLKKLKLEELKILSINAGILLSSLSSAAAGTIGGMAAAGLTTSAVMALGTASTGTAISGLSGVAATNATLAYLGGGSLAVGGGGMALGSALLSGATFGVGLMVGGFIFDATGSKMKEKAEQLYDKMKENKKEIDKVCEFLNKLNYRTKIYSETFDRITYIYYENLKKMDNIVNGFKMHDYTEYNEKIKKSLKILVLSCKLLRDMLNVKLLNENNEINENIISDLSKIAITEDEILKFRN